ncbi:hypothetical protein M758_4G053700 [Ceratodon purpureus]|nr:hypothetical protein M758_4G053700 [Ceratodon purpureus]
MQDELVIIATGPYSFQGVYAVGASFDVTAFIPLPSSFGAHSTPSPSGVRLFRHLFGGVIFGYTWSRLLAWCSVAGLGFRLGWLLIHWGR